MKKNQNTTQFISLLRTKEGLYDLFLSLVWGSGILRFFKFTVAHNSTTLFLEPYFHIVLLLLFSLLTIKSIANRFQKGDILFCLICLCIFFSHFLLYIDNMDILMQFIYVFPIFTLPFFIWGAQMDIEKLDTYFRPISYLNILLYFIYSFFYIQHKFVPGTLDGEYYMREAYIVLPYTLYALWCAMRQFNIKDFIMSLLGIFLLFSYGTRGPIVCMFAFVVLYYLLVTTSKYKIPLLIIFSTFGILFWHYFENILAFLIEFMPKLGMSNRIFTSMANNAFASYENSSNRDIIIKQLIDAMDVSGPWGYGLCGSWNICGGYAHNFALDLIVSFGTPIGILLLLGTLFLLFKGFTSCASEKEKGFFLILLCSGFLKLFISNFFLREGLFWLLIGYCFFLIRKKHAITPI